MLRTLCLCLLILPLQSYAADETYQVEGLNNAATIKVDEWGVPHLYANDHYDAFFVQGFNAARDRLWQIDLWRKRGLGELSSVLGPAFVEQDQAARMFLYRDDMFREWLAYGNDAKRISTAFTAGINAFVQLTRESPALLPIEFRILNYKPSIWTPSDVVRIRSNGLWRNLTREVERARFVCRYGLEADARRFRLEPDWQTKVPKGLDPCDIPKDVDRLYRLAKAPVDFRKVLQFTESVHSVSDECAIAMLEDRDLGAGSNNWAVTGARTKSGRPILANDPHRGHAVPSLRYAAHLIAPGLNVIGAGEPALPGISIGHNERIAFGLTIFSIDQEDLMVYEIKDGQYRYRDNWHDFKVIEERFEVAEGLAQTRKLRFTVHGPVIASNEKHAFAVQAAWLEPGMAPYFGSVEYMRAKNWREFLGALNRWGAPSENQVYADIDGNIGYKPAGLAPIRPNHDGLLPVPGNGRYDWQGYYDMDALPVSYNPRRGWVGTANAMSLPPDYPYREIKPGFEWAQPWRINRIAEVLDRQDQHTMQDSTDLQRDYLSIPARKIITSLNLAELPPTAKMLFTGWDFKLNKDSAAAALFETWFSRHLDVAVMNAALPDVATIDLGRISNVRVVEYFLDMPSAQRHAVAADTLTSAITELLDILGKDHKKWEWGQLHTIHFEHPLAELVDDDVAEKLWMPLVSRGGSGDTPNSTRYDANFKVMSGGSWRMVLDVGNWDNAFMTNAPGQSGDPDSPHYDDLLVPWAEDGQFPLLYSKELIDKHTVKTIRLEPRR